MRKPDEMAWYLVNGADGSPRAVHAIKHLMPEGSKEITAAEAAQISKDVRAREPKASPLAPQAVAPGVYVDLGPLHDQIEAIKKTVVDHAHTLDTHETKIDATQASVSEYLQGVKAGKPA